MKRKANLKPSHLKKKALPKDTWDEIDVFGRVEPDPIETASATPIPPMVRRQSTLALNPAASGKNNQWIN